MKAGGKRRGARIEERGARVERRGPRVEGRGPPLERRGVRVALVMALFSVLLVGCGRSPEPKPIADSTMVNLLVEFHLANGRIEVTDQPFHVLRDSILRSYGVDSTSYAETVEYYTRRPEEYSRVYGRVLDRLTAERIPVGRSTRPDSARFGR